MIETAFSYVPIDRRIALVGGHELPSRVVGTGLDADLSGFTALTEALARQFGEQRGAEELARRLNVIYDGLIDLVHRFGGTVLGFAGDAFSAWFDGDDGMRAVACGQALQVWMTDHAAAASGGLTAPRLKVAVATGSTRRFLVGDPLVQLYEGLAGAVVDELAAAGHDTAPGEVVLSESTRRSLDGRVVTSDSGALVTLLGDPQPAPWRQLKEIEEQRETVRPWLLPPVFARLEAGEGEFLAELRPGTALFLRMSGIAYETDPLALDRLDTFIREVQRVLSNYEGTLIQLTVGDKGSYLYAAFGAPIAHEDDKVRALLAALELRDLGNRGLVDPVSIGVATGRLRAGAYGGTQRRTYGVLGDTVNLAARLMQAAGPGEVMVTRALREHGSGGFRWTDLDDLSVKGKSESVGVARLDGVRTVVPRPRGPEPSQPATMLGRTVELAALTAALSRVASGRGEVVAVIAEAGIGKSRLVSELLGVARAGQLPTYQADCPSYGVNGSYLVWQPLLQQLLDLPEQGSAAAKATAVQARLAQVDPTLAARAPILGPAVGVDIPDTDLTRSLDAKVRKASLEATLADWLRATVDRPTLLVLEDCHWIDPLSEDLLEAIGRAVRELPVLVVTTSRPRGETEGGALAVTSLPHYTEVVLDRLGDADVELLIRRRLELTSLPRGLGEEISRLAARAEGNPFYVEELVDWIIELGPDAADPARLAELPSTLQSLVLSRIDRLAEGPRSMLKVASAIGRVFPADLLAPVHAELGSDVQVQASLAVLERGDFVLAETPSEQIYEFRHAITQEVAYSTIVGETRGRLHGRIGRLLEQRAGEDTDRVLDVLAHHFSRGDDRDRRRQYVLRAADAAQRRCAYRAAVDGFRNVLDLLDGEQRLDTLIKLGRSLSLLGRLDDAAGVFNDAQAGAAASDDVVRQSRAVIELGELSRKQGRYDEAQARFATARTALDAAGDPGGVAEVLHLSATVAAQRGQTAMAREWYEQSLGIRRELGDRLGVSRALNGLGIVAEYENDLARAAALYAESLEILIEIDDRWGVAALTNNTGYALLLQGKATEALPMFERAVALQREIGDPSMLANFLSNLGDAERELGQLRHAMQCYEESLRLARELGERWLVAYLLEDVAVVAARENQPERAVRLAAAGARLRDEIGAPLPPESQRLLDQRLALPRQTLTADELQVAETDGVGLSFENAVDEALQTISSSAFHRN